MLRHQLPSIYQDLLPSEFLDFAADEKLATCDNCLKAQPGQSKPYHKDLKCCTYHPFLPNYLVGAIIESRIEAAQEPQAAFTRKLQEDEYALPLGLLAPIKLQIAYSQRIPDDFGNRADWLCPYYQKESNNCGIWQNRPAYCSSYFCKSSYGRSGQIFWQEFQNYLRWTEDKLAAYALQILGFDRELIELNLSYLDRRSGDIYERTFSHLKTSRRDHLWRDKYQEAELIYTQAYRAIKNTTRSELDSLTQGEGRERLKKAQAALKEI